MPTLLAELHAPLEPILREVMMRTGWQPGGLVLDVGCGAGLKRALFDLVLGPQGRVVGIDIDRTALRVAQEQHADTTSAWITGDAAALPVCDGCVDGVACIATLGLLPDQPHVLRELRRVLAPDGTALVVTATQCWSAVHPWSSALAVVLAQAYRRAREAGMFPPSSELGDAVTNLLQATGFTNITTHAFLLDPPVADPLEAELVLTAWPIFRPYLASHLSRSELVDADAVAATPEDVQLVPVLLAAMGSIDRIAC